jgi:branched-subunit amino acid aminotransferase/4-amino-4-deoxychorismate lyase
MAFAPPDRGGGVFETLLVRDGRLQALDLHLARMAGSLAAVYGARLPAGVRAQALARAAGLAGEHRLRIDATPAPDRIEVNIATSPLSRDRSIGVRCVPTPAGQGLGAHKWRDRAFVEHAAASGAAVPLLVATDGSVLEAAWANFWLLEGDRLITPPAGGTLLPGVTRARLIALAPSLGLTVAQEPIALAVAREARHTLLTSSLALAVAAGVDREPPAPDPGCQGCATIARIRAALSGGDWTPG